MSAHRISEANHTDENCSSSYGTLSSKGPFRKIGPLQPLRNSSLTMHGEMDLSGVIAVWTVRDKRATSTECDVKEQLFILFYVREPISNNIEWKTVLNTCKRES